MSDYDSTNGYGSEDWNAYGAGAAPEYIAPTPSAHANATGPVVTGNAQVSTLRRGLEGAAKPGLGGVFGDFDATQRCYVVPLARLAWAFIATAAEGRTADALGILSVYRSLYNSQRGAIVSGFSAAAREALPASLPEIAWTDPMRLSMQLVLSGATGGRPERNAALNAMPNSVAALGTWFAGARGAFDETNLRTYLEIPRVGGETVAASVLRAVPDDVARCIAPSPGPVTIGPATGIRCPPGQILVAGRCQQATAYVPPSYVPPSQNPPGPPGPPGPPEPPAPRQSGGTGILIGLLVVLAAGAWWVYRDEERIAREKALNATE